MKNKSWKTNLVGITGLITLGGCGALVYFGKATFTEVASGLSFITLFLLGVLGILTKDKDVTGLPK